MPNGTYDLVDRDYGVVNSPKNLRSIRFKSETFRRITGFWNKFRIGHYQRKMEKATNEFKNMEFSTATSSETMEKKIMKKARAVAKIEEKLSILHNIPVSIDYVESRAIKLKNNMMNNLVFNSNNAYSVPDEVKDELFTTTNTEKETPDTEKEVENKDENIDQVMEDEEKKLADEVKKIVDNEKEEVAKEEVKEPVDDNDKNVRDDIIVVPEREVREVLDKEFSKQEENYKKQEENKDVEKIENAEPEAPQNDEHNTTQMEDIDREEIKRAVEDAMRDVKISKNGATSAKIEKYVNPKDNTYVRDDGTYRLRREDIDEDFRITKINEFKNNIPKINPKDVFRPVDSPEVGDGEEAIEENIDEVPEEVALEQPENNEVEEVVEEANNDEVVETREDNMNEEEVEEAAEVQEDNVNEENVEEVAEVQEDDMNEESVEEEAENETTSEEEMEESTHFNYDEDSVKNLTEAIDRAGTKDDIQALLNRVKKLKEKQDESKRLAEEARLRKLESEKAKENALNKLRDYESALNEDLGFNRRAAEEDRKKAESNEELIEEMLKMIQPEAKPDSIRTK